jgi:SdpC family antimicrobial peptide
MERAVRRITACVSLAAFGLTTTGCSEVAGIVAPAEAAPAAASYSGEELYQGLVLGWGPVAEALPFVRQHYSVTRFENDPAQLQLFEAVQARIVSSIATERPDFFGRFAERIQSGDHFEIDKALREASEVTAVAVRSMPEMESLRAELATNQELREAVRASLSPQGAEMGMDPEELASLALAFLSAEGDQAYDPGTQWVAFAAFLTFAVAVNVAAVATVALVSVAVVTKMGAVDITATEAAMAGTTGRRLLEDRFIHAVANWN